MGCQHSQLRTKRNQQEIVDGRSANCVVTTSASMNQSPKRDSVVELTTRHKELIIDSWKLLVDNISSVGVITFMKLFETHPDVQDVFMPFKGMSQEELKHSKQLRAHGLRVMGFVQKVVARIDEPDKSELILKELGRNHVRYGAKIQYVDLIGPQFVYAVKPSLEDEWTQEIEDAWMQLFAYISSIMKMAMIEETGTVEDSTTTPTEEDDIKDIKKD